MFNQQPGPIQVRGTLALQITLPQLNGSYSYLPENGSRVLLMGQSADTFNIVPIGVGILNNHIGTSVMRINGTQVVPATPIALYSPHLKIFACRDFDDKQGLTKDPADAHHYNLIGCQRCLLQYGLQIGT